MLRELSPLHRELRHAIPNVYKGFGELSKAAFEPGALDRKTEGLQGSFAAAIEPDRRQWGASLSIPHRVFVYPRGYMALWRHRR